MNNGFSKWLVAALPLIASSAAHGETLRQALIYDYRINPSLKVARAGLRPTDEGVPPATVASHDYKFDATTGSFPYRRNIR